MKIIYAIVQDRRVLGTTASLLIGDDAAKTHNLQDDLRVHISAWGAPQFSIWRWVDQNPLMDVRNIAPNQLDFKNSDKLVELHGPEVLAALELQDGEVLLVRIEPPPMVAHGTSPFSSISRVVLLCAHRHRQCQHSSTRQPGRTRTT